MSVMDEQVELLEAYLDGALTAEDARRVEGLIASDEEWGRMLAELREARAARAAVFSQMEPSVLDARRVADRAIAATQAGRGWGRLAAWMRISGAVAACLMVSFFAGWAIRGKQPKLGGAASVARVSNETSPHVDGAYQVTLTDHMGRVIGVQRFGSLEQAKEFAGDLRAWQERQQRMRQGAAVLVADEF